MNFLANKEERNKKGEVIETISSFDKEQIDNLLNSLDEDQRAAVLGELKDTLLIAIAGAGKTRTLTSKVAYSILTGIREEQIMLLTFTNKAADEMIKRVKQILKKDNVSVLAGTFHHVAVVFLRRYAKKLGYGNNFAILTPDDASDLMGLCRQKFLAENKELSKDFPNKSVLYDIYSKIINLNKNLTLINAQFYGYSLKVERAIETILEDYDTRKKENNSMDFDDLLKNFYILLLQNPDVVERISASYPIVFTDEFQDVNFIQNEILQMLKNNGKSILWVVGDPEQSIYKFRGSRVDFINKFELNNPGCNVFKLRYNYRSHKDILELATNSINHNFLKYKKEMLEYLPYLKKPVIISAENEFKQAQYIANCINAAHKSNVPYKEIAILIRSNYLTKVLEMVFQRENIPYRILCGVSFFDRQHVRDILAFIKFMSNPLDEVAFSRIGNLFEGVGAKTSEKLYNNLKELDFDFNNIDISLLSFKPTKKAVSGIEKLLALLRIVYNESVLENKILSIISYHYGEYLKVNFDDHYSRQEDLNSLVETAKLYSNVDSFLEDLILESNKKVEEEDKDDKVVITSVHKSKGLEWDYVYLPYLNENIFPSRKSTTHEEIEEERRLFYVACTRARKSLEIGFIGDSAIMNDVSNPSKFITELNENLFDFKVVR